MTQTTKYIEYKDSDLSDYILVFDQTSLLVICGSRSMTDGSMINLIKVLSARTGRLMREIKSLADKPPWGIICKPAKDDELDVLLVKMLGPRGSPYEKGKFELVVNVPDKYPFEPLQVKFVTPVYHPNIDKGGRICMDMLKMPPKGSWLPTISIETLLISIQSLLANPNPDDPLMLDLANEYKYDIEQFMENARKHTEQFAV